MDTKKFELHDDDLDRVIGGTDEDDGWYWGYGFPPDFLNACPVCGGGVYYDHGLPEQGGDRYQCGPCGWMGHSMNDLAPGYIERPLD